MRYVIAGFGHFGKIAVKRLGAAFPGVEIVVIDPKGFEGADFGTTAVTSIEADAVSALRDAYDMDDSDVVVPMVPFHLAAAYVLAKRSSVRETVVPEYVAEVVPNPFRLNASTIACSRADFLCPDDCPEGACCTVTGRPRGEPLYESLAKLKVPGFQVRVQRSYQLLPGVGGYILAELRDLTQQMGPGKAIIATACGCHGILTAMEVD